ncbi:hypothetical protein ACO2RV_14505 [Ancylobacter sp. VNQ12]|uniref:hypothetical protein n=1 Tax=Ancylobacter sp. VNQ12 TaxID=3400920 RepID=UPI003C01C840
MAVTYYVVLPFGRNDEGDLVPGEGHELPSAMAVIRRAAAIAPQHAGVIAFSRDADLATGDYSPAVILARHGETPDEVE